MDRDISSNGAEGPVAVRRKARRQPRRVTARYLEQAALHYLERYSTSVDNLRRVLTRKVVRSARVHDTDESEGRAMVESLLDRFLQLGLLDDVRYAQNQARRLFDRGTSRRMIIARLRAKGLEPTVIEDALTHLGDLAREPEMAAACAYVRRRRLGPFRERAAREQFHDRDLAALARAGFSYQVARRVMAAADREEFEAMRAALSESDC